MDLHDEKVISLCNGLEDESKSRRRSALKQLRAETLDKLTDQQHTDEVFDKIFKSILKSFSDSAEMCRELAINIVLDFIPKLKSTDKYLTYIVTVLVQRICDDDHSEPSEEIRLLLITLLSKIVEKSDKSLIPYLNDITKIICKSLSDPFPKIKSESCECIVLLTKAIPKDFHVQSDTYLKAVMTNVAHKHSKVRAVSIFALGVVIQHGTHGLIEQVTGVLAERLYDSNVSVRQAVINVGGSWLCSMNDRYAQFARLLPLVLTGLDDTLPEVAQLAKEQWQKAGAQYLAENEEEYKSQIDFLSDSLSNLQLQETRPSLGCRLLVHKEAGKLFPAALAELHEWTLPVRLQAAALLQQLVIHLEKRSTQYVPKLWPDFALVCADEGEDTRLKEKVESTLHLLGYFVPASTLLPVALSQEHLSLGQLRCLSAILHGMETLHEPELTTLVTALFTTTSASVQIHYQSCLVSCVQAVVKSAESNSCCDIVSLNLFKVLLSAQGLGDPQLRSTAQEALSGLAHYVNTSPEELYVKHGEAILSSLVASVPVWSDYCAEKCLFTSYVQGAGTSIGAHLELVAKILVSWSQVTSSAKSLADWLRVCQALLNWSFLSSCKMQAKYLPDNFVTQVLTEAVIPHLVWKAGRVAEAKRSQSLLCLLLSVSDPTIPSQVLQPLQTTLLPLLVAALEESNKLMRLHACQALGLLCPHWAPHMTAEHVRKTYSVLVKRLDDTGEEVRLQALETLQLLLLQLPENHKALTHLEDLYKMMFIHLDDQDTKYQQAVLGALKKLGKFETKTMLNLVNKGQKNFRNQDGCNNLKLHLEALLKN